MKVNGCKTFWAISLEKLEELINNFLTTNPNIEVVNMVYSHENKFDYTAILIYRKENEDEE